MFKDVLRYFVHIQFNRKTSYYTDRGMMSRNTHTHIEYVFPLITVVIDSVQGFLGIAEVL